MQPPLQPHFLVQYNMVFTTMWLQLNRVLEKEPLDVRSQKKNWNKGVREFPPPHFLRLLGSPSEIWESRITI